MYAFVRTISMYIMVGMMKNKKINNIVHVIFKRYSVDVKRDGLRDSVDKRVASCSFLFFRSPWD